MGYRKALEKLEAYEPRELAEGYYVQWTCPDLCKGTMYAQYCAIGALVPDARRLPASLLSAPLSLVWGALKAPLEELRLTFEEARELQAVNDGEEMTLPYETPRHRYERVVGWLRERVKEEEG